VEEETGDGIGEERAASPPPPRCPTSWVVHPSTSEEKECFREQVYCQDSVFCSSVRSLMKASFLLIGVCSFLSHFSLVYFCGYWLQQLLPPFFANMDVNID
jgi:hypothetical protein